ncbi:Tudor domain [Popillia japonica]|uniref:Tudor domain n=1 Tax=Popillia japonica TaxID=7064 RepID=A0AAW1LRU7_POPJA
MSAWRDRWEGEVVEGGKDGAPPEETEPAECPPGEIEVVESEIEVVAEEMTETPPIGFHVVISHIDTPNEFYLQQSEAVESINLLQEELQEQISNLPNLENPTAGVLCAAPYFNQWFRALVLDADEDITTVRFVDVGNTDVITNSTAHVKTLPAEMLSIEYHAKLCSLFVKPIGEEWSTAAQDKFLQYKTVENLTAEIVHQDEKTTYVELYANGQNVGEILKQDGLAADLQLETEANSTGFISHLNSPSEFWIQLESSCSDLEWVADQLANAESYPALEDLTPGSLCAAVFSDDDAWYRARILSNTVAGLEVIFIDYGNSCSCNGLRELPEDLIMLPPLALKCSLQKPNGILQWSQASTDKFKEISADGATVFNVNILTPGETSIVQLTYDDQDVSAQLVPETRQCFVSHVDSVDSFWVQFMDDNAKIENLTETMENAENWPEITEAEVGDLVAALFEDELWYRAKVLEKIDGEYQVLFVDYGNTTGVSLLRQLPEECAQLEALASNFKLDMLPRTKWGDRSDELFTSMTECGVAMFDIELVAENTARLYLNGLDVRSSLECVKCTPSVSLQSSPKKAQTETVQQVISEEVEHQDASDVIEIEVRVESTAEAIDANDESDQGTKTNAAEAINANDESNQDTKTDAVEAINANDESNQDTKTDAVEAINANDESNQDTKTDAAEAINANDESNQDTKTDAAEAINANDESNQDTKTDAAEAINVNDESDQGIKTDAAEIIGTHLDEILEAVVDSSQSNSSPVESLKKSPETDLVETIEIELSTEEIQTESPSDLIENVAVDEKLNTPGSDLSSPEKDEVKSPETSPDSNLSPMTSSPIKETVKTTEIEASDPNTPTDSPKKSAISEPEGDVPKCDNTNQEQPQIPPIDTAVNTDASDAKEIDTNTTDCDKTEEEETKLCIEGHSPKKDKVSDDIPDERKESKLEEK